MAYTSMAKMCLNGNVTSRSLCIEKNIDDRTKFFRYLAQIRVAHESLPAALITVHHRTRRVVTTQRTKSVTRYGSICTCRGFVSRRGPVAVTCLLHAMPQKYKHKLCNAIANVGDVGESFVCDLGVWVLHMHGSLFGEKFLVVRQIFSTFNVSPF